MADHQRPPESPPSMNELLRAARGKPYAEPKTATDAQINDALRVAFGRPGRFDERAAEVVANEPAASPDFGGGPRGLTGLPGPRPSMSDLLRAAGSRRGDVFGGINDVFRNWFDPED